MCLLFERIGSRSGTVPFLTSRFDGIDPDQLEDEKREILLGRLGFRSALTTVTDSFPYHLACDIFALAFHR